MKLFGKRTLYKAVLGIYWESVNFEVKVCRLN